MYQYNDTRDPSYDQYKDRRDPSFDMEKRPAHGSYEPHSHRMEPQPIMSQPGPTFNNANSNTVVINAGQTTPAVVSQQRMWSTGMCDCFSDCGICLCVFFCGPCYLCKMSMDMGESCCVPVCVMGSLMALRIKMRIQENIQGSILDDCCMTACCPPCVQCQLAREVKHVRMTRH